MARHRFAIKQRTLGGFVGLAVLIFALVYHFFPNLLDIPPQPVAEQGGQAAKMAPAPNPH